MFLKMFLQLVVFLCFDTVHLHDFKDEGRPIDSLMICPHQRHIKIRANCSDVIFKHASGVTQEPQKRPLNTKNIYQWDYLGFVSVRAKIKLKLKIESVHSSD